MNERDDRPQSAGGVGKATLAALLVAAVILAVVIWPTDDPPEPEADAAAPDAPVADSRVDDDLASIMEGNVRDADPGSQISYPEPFKTETLRISLAAFEEVEYKARMNPGDTLVYSWTSPRAMYVDFHGEPDTYPEEPVARYEEIDGTSAGHGRLTANFPGLHGWFWLNVNEVPVEIELTVSGYYETLEEIYRSAP